MQVGAVLWRSEECERARWEPPVSLPVRGALPSCRVGAAERYWPCERLPERQPPGLELASWGCRAGARSFPTERCRTRSRRSRNRQHPTASPDLLIALGGGKGAKPMHVLRDV